MAKKKSKATTLRVSMSDEEEKIINEYFDNHPELVKQVIYGQAIVTKIKELREVDNG